jgi:Protein of unknown function (DUF3313)
VIVKKAFAALCVVALCACSVTQQDKPESGSSVPTSGFLGDYSQLKPGPEGQALLVYYNPNANWGQYNAVIIDPVTIGFAPERQISEQDQAMLANYYRQQITQNLSKTFAIVNEPGPNVMRLRVALTDATTATPVLRTVSVVIPQARILNGVKDLASGTYAFVGSARSEGEVLDSVTGVRLAAAVDQRSGGLSIKNADVWQWGDAENAMDFWAQRMAERLTQLHNGQPVVSQR